MKAAYLASIASLWLIHSTSATGEPNTKTHFDWISITTAEELRYQPCYDEFECARLYVPLDWNNASSPHNLSLAIVRLPARVPESDPKHGGTIITNPGGPGGSGVEQVLLIARKLQKLLDGPKHYEILSFDPRGIFHSKPNAYCFNNAVEEEIWDKQKRAAGALDSSEYALKYNWASEMAHGELCATTDRGKFDDGENLRQHMSTASVARDMLEIVKKIHRHRPTQYRGENQQPFDTSFLDTDEKLQYIGTSYGTFLGQTFAAMYPNHVGRMILDSNIDAENWISRYEFGIQDAAEIRDYFFESCYSAGSECALYREYDRSSDDIRTRFDQLTEALQEFPSYISGLGRAAPITISNVRQGFFTTSYQPLWYFKDYAKFLNKLITDVNPGVPFWQLPIPKRDAFSDEKQINLYLGGEVGPATHCSDGPDLSSEGLVGFKGYLSNLTARFDWGGGIQAAYKIPCWTWPSSLRTKWRFEGPFNSSVPILFVNNRLDPATGLRNAETMAGKFNGSIVLEQDSVGHGALWPASPCMWGHVKRYMDTGVLPQPGSICEPLCKPFGPKCDDISAENYFTF